MTRYERARHTENALQVENALYTENSLQVGNIQHAENSLQVSNVQHAENSLHADNAIAFGFLAEEDEPQGKLLNRYIQLFYTAYDARRVMACATTEVQFLICERASEITPLNLAAAVHKDNPCRDIYVEKANPTALFVSRVEASGARGVVSREDVRALLGLHLIAEEAPEENSSLNLGLDAELSFGALGRDCTQQEGLFEDDPTADWVSQVLFSETLRDEVAYLSRNTDEVAGSGGEVACEELYLSENNTLELSNSAGDETYCASTMETEAPTQEFDLIPSEKGISASGQIASSLSHTANPASSPELKLPQVTGASLSFPDDISWLEQVLDLDDLDDFFSGGGPVIAERPAREHAGINEDPVPAPCQFLMEQHPEKKKGVSAAFISGRGGVGKSSLAVLTALTLWRTGLRVVLFDMDLQFGDISVLAGNEPEVRIKRLCLDQLSGNTMRIPPIEDALLLLESPAHPELAEELVRLIPDLLATLQHAADVVVINTSCLWDEVLAVLASSVDKLILCMDQRATSVSAARQVMDLCIRLQIPSTRFIYLLNRCARNAPITDIDASLAMGGADIVSIADGGSDVDELLSLGCPLECLRAQSSLRQTVDELGKELVPSSGNATIFRRVRS